MFFEPETLEYRCQKCKSTEAQMEREVIKAPKALNLNLKRFQADASNFGK